MAQDDNSIGESTSRSSSQRLVVHPKLPESIRSALSHCGSRRARHAIIDGVCRVAPLYLDESERVRECHVFVYAESFLKGISAVVRAICLRRTESFTSKHLALGPPNAAEATLPRSQRLGLGRGGYTLSEGRTQACLRRVLPMSRYKTLYEGFSKREDGLWAGRVSWAAIFVHTRRKVALSPFAW